MHGLLSAREELGYEGRRREFERGVCGLEGLV